MPALADGGGAPFRRRPLPDRVRRPPPRRGTRCGCDRPLDLEHTGAALSVGRPWPGDAWRQGPWRSSHPASRATARGSARSRWPAPARTRSSARGPGQLGQAAAVGDRHLLVVGTVHDEQRPRRQPGRGLVGPERGERRRPLPPVRRKARGADGTDTPGVLDHPDAFVGPVGEGGRRPEARHSPHPGVLAGHAQAERPAGSEPDDPHTAAVADPRGVIDERPEVVVPTPEREVTRRPPTPRRHPTTTGYPFSAGDAVRQTWEGCRPRVRPSPARPGSRDRARARWRGHPGWTDPGATCNASDARRPLDLSPRRRHVRVLLAGRPLVGRAVTQVRQKRQA